MNIKNDDLVKVTDMNTMVEIKLCSNSKPPKAKIKRLNKTQYVEIDTGEVKEYKPRGKGTSSRRDNPESLARTGRKTKELIICNFVDKSRTQYITLTYNEHIFDYKQASKDFNAFVKNIRRHYCKNNKMQYVVVQEEHYDSAFHFHCVFYWEKEYPQDMVKNLDNLWSKGVAVHRPIKDNSDILFIAAYLVSGFFDNGKKADKNDIAKVKDEKAAIKNARLENLPAYKRAVKHSKNMFVPIKDEMLYAEARDVYKFAECFNERTFEKKINGYKITNEYEYYLT